MSGTRPTRMVAGMLLGALSLILFSPLASAADLALLRNGFTIRHEHRQLLGETTRLFLDSGTASYIDVPTEEIQGFEKDMSLLPPPPSAEPPRPAWDMNEIVNSASARYRLDPDLVNSVIRAESGFNPRARSRKGAQGLMQLMPETAGQLGVKNPFDARANVSGGTRYLRELLERYNFDLVKALAAYNAGPLRVEQYRGVPPYRETRAYVAKIVRDYNRKKIAQEKQVKAASKTNRARSKPSPNPASAGENARRDAAAADAVRSP